MVNFKEQLEPKIKSIIANLAATDKLSDSFVELLEEATIKRGNFKLLNLLQLIASASQKRKIKSQKPNEVFESDGILTQQDALSNFQLACHFINCASSILDDVIDLDNSDSFVAVHGSSSAILIAMCVWFLAEQQLQEIKTPVRSILVDYIHRSLTRSAFGQFLDIESNRAEALTKITAADSIERAGLKTGVFLEMICLSTALVVTEDAQIADIYAEVGFRLGLIEQLCNDLAEGYNEDLTHNNLHQRKEISLPLAYALESSKDHDRSELLQIWSKSNPEKADTDRLLELIEKNGFMNAAFFTIYKYLIELKGILEKHQPLVEEDLLLVKQTEDKITQLGLRGKSKVNHSS